MKIFAIKDQNDFTNKELAYLYYFEKSKKFYIELPESSDSWEVPLILSSFVKKKQYTINSYWSRMWVQERIIPTDRQNLGLILKENNLNEYDEFKMLELTNGVCEQDDYYLEKIKSNDVPKEIKDRMKHKVDSVFPISDYNLVVFFRDGKCKKYNAKYIFENYSNWQIKDNFELFKKVQIDAGGYGVNWGSTLFINDEELYSRGKLIPLCIEDFIDFVSGAVVNSSEAADIIGCSRQNIDDLVKRDKIHPIKQTDKMKLFLKSEITEYISL